MQACPRLEAACCARAIARFELTRDVGLLHGMAARRSVLLALGLEGTLIPRRSALLSPGHLLLGESGPQPGGPLRPVWPESRRVRQLKRARRGRLREHALQGRASPIQFQPAALDGTEELTDELVLLRDDASKGAASLSE